MSLRMSLASGMRAVWRRCRDYEPSVVPQVRVPRLDANLGREGRNEPQVSPNEGRIRDTH